MNKLLNYKEYLMENEDFNLDEDYDSDYELDEYDELDETKYGNPITGALKIDHHIVNYKRQKAKAGNVMLSAAARAHARKKMQHHKNRIRQMMDEGFYHDDDDLIGEGVYTALAGEHHLKNYRIARHIANNPHKSEAARARARARMEKHAGYISRMVGEKV